MLCLFKEAKALVSTGAFFYLKDLVVKLFKHTFVSQTTGDMKLLIIENDGLVPNEVRRIQQKLQPKETKEITAFQYADPKEVFAAVMWCDAILIQTTLIHKYQVDEMVELMAKLPPKQIIFTWEDTVKDLYEYLSDDDNIVKMAHHKIGYFPHDFQIEDGWEAAIHNTSLFADKAVIVAEKLRLIEEEKQRRLAAEKLYRDEAPNRPTGQMVLVKTVMATGKEWANLKTGQVLPALDMSEQDPRHNRGIWVMGVTEPVKLLNDSGYDEYEIVVSEETPIRDIAVEVLKMADVFEVKEKDIYGVIGFIEDALADNENKSSQLHWNLTAWLDDNDIPRRGNRNKIEAYLNRVLAKRLKMDLVVN